MRLTDRANMIKKQEKMCHKEIMTQKNEPPMTPDCEHDHVWPDGMRLQTRETVLPQIPSIQKKGISNK